MNFGHFLALLTRPNTNWKHRHSAAISSSHFFYRSRLTQVLSVLKFLIFMRQNRNMLSLNFSPFPFLQTERLRLRNIVPADAPDLFVLRSDRRVMKFLGRPLAKTEADALAQIQLMLATQEKEEGIAWGICLKDNEVLAGTIGFWRLQKEHFRAEIGYLLHPSLQGKGLMREAMEAVLHYGFTVMNLHSVEANVNPANTASIGLLKRTGFVQEAYFRENYYDDGKFVDSAIYSLLAPAEI